MSEKKPIMALVPTTIAEVQTLAETLAKSELVPEVFRKKPADVFLAIGYGQELGLPPIASLRAIAVIKGKPTLYADAMVAVVMSSGAAEYFVAIEDGPERATYETKRRGAPAPVRKSFSLEDAKNAGLMTNHNYKAYPRHMLEARAKAWLARDLYPDLLHGIHSAEEVSEFRDDSRPAFQPAPTMARPPAFQPAPTAALPPAAEVIDTSRALLERILAAGSQAELDVLLPDLGRAPERAKQELREQYAIKKRRLAPQPAPIAPDPHGDGPPPTEAAP